VYVPDTGFVQPIPGAIRPRPLPTTVELAPMPYTIKKFQSTPNPNAVKCVLDRRIGAGVRSYFKAEDAAGDPLAAGLFGIGDVTNVLINGDWITVSKTPAADWGTVKAGIERVLRGAE
jgi:hypothetical protein